MKSNVEFQYNKWTYLLHKTFLFLFPYYLTMVINKNIYFGTLKKENHYCFEFGAFITYAGDQRRFAQAHQLML